MRTVTAAPPKTGLILLLLCAAQFMVVLDIAIVNVALPSIQADLAMSQDSLQWVVIAYGLMLGGFLMLGGRLADLVGRKRVLISGPMSESTCAVRSRTSCRLSMFFQNE